MSVKTCPHCSHEIPAGMEVMPVCVMCGGDLNATPTQTWSTIDLNQQGKTYNCHACNAEIKSVLTTECPSCGAALQLAAPATPEQIAATLEPVTIEPDPIPEPVAPEPEPVVAAPEPVPAAPEPAQPKLEPLPVPEPARPKMDPLPTPEPVAAKPAAAPKEGFFGKLLRMLGLKK